MCVCVCVCASLLTNVCICAFKPCRDWETHATCRQLKSNVQIPEVFNQQQHKHVAKTYSRLNYLCNIGLKVTEVIRFQALVIISLENKIEQIQECDNTRIALLAYRTYGKTNQVGSNTCNLLALLIAGGRQFQLAPENSCLSFLAEMKFRQYSI